MRRTYTEIRCSVGKTQPQERAVGMHPAFSAPYAPKRPGPTSRMVFIGPGSLNGKTALVHAGRHSGFVAAQFDDTTLLVPHVRLSLATPWWGTLGFGWTMFQSRFFRKI